MRKRIGILTVFLILSSFQTANALSDVPYYEQERWNWCGVAVIQSVLEYYGATGSQREIAGGLGYNIVPDRPRLSINKMSDYFTYKYGLDVYLYRTTNDTKSMDILRHYVVDEGIPVVVLQRKYVGSSEGHYRIVVGFEEGEIVVLDPISGLLFIPEEDFLSLWQANSAIKFDNQMLVVERKT